MKIQVVFKTPDILEDQEPKILILLKKFVKYEEYITIEFDTETETARIVPVAET